MEDTSFKHSAGTFRRSATATIKRYRQLPRITPMTRFNMLPFPMIVSPIIRLASAIVTMPVPRLISQDFWYCASSPPESPVSALATHRPIVIIIPVLMLDARTISGLSPVARMESPSLVFKNREINTPTNATITAATISLYQVPPIASFAHVNTESQANRFRLEANPITAILIV